MGEKERDKALRQFIDDHLHEQIQVERTTPAIAYGMGLRAAWDHLWPEVSHLRRYYKSRAGLSCACRFDEDLETPIAECAVHAAVRAELQRKDEELNKANEDCLEVLRREAEKDALIAEIRKTLETDYEHGAPTAIRALRVLKDSQ